MVDEELSREETLDIDSGSVGKSAQSSSTKLLNVEEKFTLS